MNNWSDMNRSDVECVECAVDSPPHCAALLWKDSNTTQHNTKLSRWAVSSQYHTKCDTARATQRLATGTFSCVYQVKIRRLVSYFAGFHLLSPLISRTHDCLATKFPWSSSTCLSPQHTPLPARGVNCCRRSIPRAITTWVSFATSVAQEEAGRRMAIPRRSSPTS